MSKNKLKQKTYKVETVGHFLSCKKCKDGLYISIGGVADQQTGQVHYYQNKCDKCGDECTTQMQYPFFENRPIGEAISEKEIEAFEPSRIQIVKGVMPGKH